MTMSETVGFAILGTGMVAEFHRQAIAANADLGTRLVAVVHHDPARFAEIGARFGVPCLSQAQMLADPDVDVVCICTPSGQHRPSPPPERASTCWWKNLWPSAWPTRTG